MRVPPTNSRRSPRLPLVALVSSALLSLAGCGGGRGGGAAAPPPRFVVPSATTNVVIGGSFDVHLTGFKPGSQVVLRIDADGDFSTTNDQYTLGAPVTASATGDIETLASTDLGSGVASGVLPVGTYVLFASEPAGPAVAIAPGAINLRSSSLTRLFEGADNWFNTVATLSDGRIAAAGAVYGTGSFPPQSGPAVFDGTVIRAGLVALYGSNGDLVTGWPLTGPANLSVSDMAAGPNGGFTLTGGSENGLTSIAGAVPGPAQASAPGIDGAGVGFEASYGSDAGLAGSTFAEPAVVAGKGTPQNQVGFSAVATPKDGSHYGVLVGAGYAALNKALLTDLGSGGLEVVHTSADGAPIDEFLALSGVGEACGIAVLADGDLLIAGTRSGAVTFAPGRAGEKAVASDVPTVFVARFHPDGSLAALFEPTAPGSAWAYALAAIPDGGCYIVGEAMGPITFAPGMTIDPSTHHSDGYVARLDAQLVPIWVRPWSASGTPEVAAFASAYCTSVAVLPGGSCVVSGATSYFAQADDDLDFGSGTGDEFDSMIVRYSAAGDVAWGVKVTGPKTQQVRDVAVDLNGAIVAVGLTNGPALIVDREGKATSLFPTLPGFQSGLLIRLDPDGRLR